MIGSTTSDPQENEMLKHDNSVSEEVEPLLQHPRSSTFGAPEEEFKRVLRKSTFTPERIHLEPFAIDRRLERNIGAPIAHLSPGYAAVVADFFMENYQNEKSPLPISKRKSVMRNFCTQNKFVLQ
ncbi:unnamed protein product [Amoebophrya sp. A120]|nr:unnamed protein product [Amoebophrya sp. A120]|eukprot:GSA120T00023841001.1